MKCRLSISLLIWIFVVMSIMGCSSTKNEVIETNLNLAGNIVDITEWPENRFTDTIRKPSSGIVDYAIDYSGNGRYAIFYSDISMEEGEEYIKELENMGYCRVIDKKENSASGLVLEKDNVMLSIFVSDGILGIYISIA